VIGVGSSIPFHGGGGRRSKRRVQRRNFEQMKAPYDDTLRRKNLLPCLALLCRPFQPSSGNIRIVSKYLFEKM
jgi:hypothetical protein